MMFKNLCICDLPKPETESNHLNVIAEVELQFNEEKTCFDKMTAAASSKV